MHGWRATRRKNDCLVHTVARGFGHGLFSPIVAHIFKVLRVSASIWEHDLEWFPLHIEPSVASFEPEHAVEEQRYAYNTRLFALACKRKKTIRGEHAGFSDFFVPILADGEVAGVLVTGPFALARPSSAVILDRWRWLTGRQGHPADPEFASYLSTTLATLALDADALRAFERLLGCLARLMQDGGHADRIANESEPARVLLEEVRRPERMWDAVREMVGERASRTWHSAMRITGLRWLGLSTVPDTVLVGLTVNREKNGDPVDEAVRRNAFQRRAVDLAHRAGGVVSGQVGDYGISFLCGGAGSPARKRQRLLELGERASAIARRELGLALYAGVAVAQNAGPLAETYQTALGAAEAALVQGIGVVVARPGQGRPAHSLRNLRHELGHDVEERPDFIGPRFDRYVEAVTLHCGYRLEPVRTHLEIGLERMADPLLRSGALDEKGFGAMRNALDRAAAEARTTHELCAAYREAVSDLCETVRRPVEARHDRSLRRAIRHIHQHYAEPLRLAEVARLSGIAPKYFSRLFRKRENVPFERYVLALRIERAKQLLTSTPLGVGRVAELSGFHSPQYFSRAFRRAIGCAPLAYRGRANKVKR